MAVLLGAKPPIPTALFVIGESKTFTAPRTGTIKVIITGGGGQGAFLANKNATPTKFHRDEKHFQTKIIPGYEKSVMDSFLSTAFSPPVEDGDILLFPPYLRHSATSLSHHRYQMRMTFSFNIDLKR